MATTAVNTSSRMVDREGYSCTAVQLREHEDSPVLSYRTRTILEDTSSFGIRGIRLILRLPSKNKFVE
ncbi:hypothetical protein HGRIS_001058 [Hohenbuehelia grisea]|uniref:Uncharacterized protein n=1 Tax=Hohenbuehelia grisea TaxID=104357 RepID=A0ABR3JN49_9AGAR